ncbi:5' exonuclease Apollo [Bulinus truncatus]|nr:5' exonuclease Apollo [Bulinus truncatus]
MLLERRHGVSRKFLHILPCNQSVVIPVTSSESFIVTCFDANHCPGSVMFYFEGQFGNVLYTGDFRINSQILLICQELSKKVDLLYLDNTYCNPRFRFPNRRECFKDILDIITKHKTHRVIIGVRKLGKEQLLGMLGTSLNETVTVSPERYHLCNAIFSTNVFATCNLYKKPTRLSTAPLHLVAKQIVEFNKIFPTIGIIPSALFSGTTERKQNPNIFVVPYSDHSNYIELIQLVSTLRPAKVVPIVTSTTDQFDTDIIDRLDMSCFDPYLFSERPKTTEISISKGMTFDNSCMSQKLCEPSPAFSEINNKRKKKIPANSMKKKAKGVIYYEDLSFNYGPGTRSSVSHKGMNHSVSLGISTPNDNVQETSSEFIPQQTKIFPKKTSDSHKEMNHSVSLGISTPNDNVQETSSEFIPQQTKIFLKKTSDSHKEMNHSVSLGISTPNDNVQETSSEFIPQQTKIFPKKTSDSHKEMNHSVSLGISTPNDNVQETSSEFIPQQTKIFPKKTSPLKLRTENSYENTSEVNPKLESDSSETVNFFPQENRIGDVLAGNNESDLAAHSVKESYIQETMSSHSHRRKRTAQKRSPQMQMNLINTPESNSSAEIIPTLVPVPPENSDPDMYKKNETGQVNAENDKFHHASNIEIQEKTVLLPQQITMATDRSLDSSPVKQRARRALCKENKTYKLTPKLGLLSLRSQRKSAKNKHFHRPAAFMNRKEDTRVLNKLGSFQKKKREIKNLKTLRKDLKDEGTSKGAALEDEFKLFFTNAIISTLRQVVKEEQPDDFTAQSRDTCTAESNLSSQGVHLAETDEVVLAAVKEECRIDSAPMSKTGENGFLRSIESKEKSSHSTGKTNNTLTGEGKSLGFAAKAIGCCSDSRTNHDYEAELILHVHGKETSAATCIKNIKLCSNCFTKRFFRDTGVVSKTACFFCDKTHHNPRRSYKLSVDTFFKTDSVKKWFHT